MKVVDWHPEDLIDKRLAGELTSPERTELDEHLAVCAACRFEALVVEDLEGETDEEDDETPADLARLVRAAVSEGRAVSEGKVIELPPPSARRRVRMGLIVGAAVLVAGSAAALYRSTQAPPVEVAAPVMQPAASIEVPVVPPAPVSEKIEPKAEEQDPEPAKPAASGTTATAASLFSRANAARRAGKRDIALGLYKQLQTQFPKSQEAKISQATVGRMMLDEDPKSALDAYDGYLKDGDGAVSEEALVGRATALQRMGKKDEERAAWQALLARYPHSLHAARAKARLAELGSAK